MNFARTFITFTFLTFSSNLFCFEISTDLYNFLCGESCEKFNAHKARLCRHEDEICMGERVKRLAEAPKNPLDCNSQFLESFSEWRVACAETFGIILPGTPKEQLQPINSQDVARLIGNILHKSYIFDDAPEGVVPCLLRFLISLDLELSRNAEIYFHPQHFYHYHERLARQLFFLSSSFFKNKKVQLMIIELTVVLLSALQLNKSAP